MARLVDIIKPFISVPDSCEEIKTYFNEGNKPKGPYIDLAKFFKQDSFIHTKLDLEFKTWITSMLDQEWEKDTDSLVLNSLKKFYDSKEKLVRFIFLEDYTEDNLQLNQKWHFFISYWCYREFITKTNKSCSRVKKLTDNFETINRNPFTHCREGKIWYNFYKNCSKGTI